MIGCENTTISIAEKRVKIKLLPVIPPWKARIRALFLFGFIVFALVAILEIVFCLVY